MRDGFKKNMSCLEQIRKSKLSSSISFWGGGINELYRGTLTQMTVSLRPIPLPAPPMKIMLVDFRRPDFVETKLRKLLNFLTAHNFPSLFISIHGCRAVSH